MTIQTAKQELEGLKGNTYYINGEPETVESYAINTGTEKVTIVTDVTERRVSLVSLGQHLKMYRKNPPQESNTADTSAGLQLLESLPSNANMAYIEQVMMENIKKLQDGNKDNIPVAETVNRMATTMLNIQKNKIEMGKLILEAHKNK